MIPFVPITVIIGTGLVLTSLFHYLYFRRIIKNGAEVEAIVIRIETQKYGDSGDATFPVFRYCYDGKYYETCYKFAGSGEKYSDNEKVKIYCDKKNPAKIAIPKEKIRIIFEVVLMAMGIGSIFIAIISTTWD
jgi:hypothetical protein